jgi:hypothetical protein
MPFYRNLDANFSLSSIGLFAVATKILYFLRPQIFITI